MTAIQAWLKYLTGNKFVASFCWNESFKFFGNQNLLKAFITDDSCVLDRRDFPGILADYETYQQSIADTTDKLILIYVTPMKISSSIWLKEGILSQFWEVYLMTLQENINCQVGFSVSVTDIKGKIKKVLSVEYLNFVNNLLVFAIPLINLSFFPVVCLPICLYICLLMDI